MSLEPSRAHPSVSAWALLVLEVGFFLLVGHPVLFGLISITGSSQQDAGSNVSLPSHDHQNRLQTVPSVPWCKIAGVPYTSFFPKEYPKGDHREKEKSAAMGKGESGYC